MVEGCFFVSTTNGTDGTNMGLGRFVVDGVFVGLLLFLF